jgi:hypothetical protein
MNLSQPQTHGKLKLTQFLLPHWKSLALALVAVIGVAITDILEPWPLKLVFDQVLRAKPMPEWLAVSASKILGDDKWKLLNFAALAVGHQRMNEDTPSGCGPERVLDLATVKTEDHQFDALSGAVDAIQQCFAAIARLYQ